MFKKTKKAEEAAAAADARGTDMMTLGVADEPLWVVWPLAT